VNERRGLECLPGGFAGDSLGGKLAQFLVNQRQQFLGSARITSLRAVKNLRHGTHRGTATRLDPAAEACTIHRTG